MRYLFPWPVPQRWRGRMIALGSGDASRIICSPLIAHAFDARSRAASNKDMHWADLLHPAEVHTAQGTLTPEIEGAMAEVA